MVTEIIEYVVFDESFSYPVHYFKRCFKEAHPNLNVGNVSDDILCLALSKGPGSWLCTWNFLETG